MLSEIIAGAALLISAYNLWQNRLRRPDLKVFVPPVVQYSSPYNNSNFEVFEIPVTLANDGAQTGTVLSIDLEITGPKTQDVKRFYSADFGRWTTENTRKGAYQPFAPISLEGRGRRTETVLFYPRSEDEKPEQLVRALGLYTFKLTLDEANLKGSRRGRPTSVEFVRELRYYDTKAFITSTLPMYEQNWRPATNS